MKGTQAFAIVLVFFPPSFRLHGEAKMLESSCVSDRAVGSYNSEARGEVARVAKKNFSSSSPHTSIVPEAQWKLFGVSPISGKKEEELISESERETREKFVSGSIINIIKVGIDVIDKRRFRHYPSSFSLALKRRAVWHSWKWILDDSNDRTK